MRLAERIHTFGRGNIVDRETYNKVFDDYLEDINAKQDKKLRNDTFDILVKKNPDVSRKSFFKEAEGKDFRQDKLRTARDIVTTRKEYEKKGARRVDLKGYDTKRGKFKERVVSLDFRQVGKVKGKVVFGRKAVFKLKGHTITRFRDRKGHFIKVKKK